MQCDLRFHSLLTFIHRIVISYSFFHSLYHITLNSLQLNDLSVYFLFLLYHHSDTAFQCLAPLQLDYQVRIISSQSDQNTNMSHKSFDSNVEDGNSAPEIQFNPLSNGWYFSDYQNFYSSSIMGPSNNARNITTFSHSHFGIVN